MVGVGSYSLLDLGVCATISFTYYEELLVMGSYLAEIVIAMR